LAPKSVGEIMPASGEMYTPSEKVDATQTSSVAKLMFAGLAKTSMNGCPNTPYKLARIMGSYFTTSLNILAC